MRKSYLRVRGEGLGVGAAIGCVVLVIAAIVAWLAFLAWMAQVVYFAFAPTDWPHPDYWVFMIAVGLISMLFGGGTRRITNK